MRPFIIGTRNSALALAQTRLAAEAVREAFPDQLIEIREIQTIGDKRLDLSLTEAAGKLDKGLFTKELEEALLDGRIDAAVHSLKDLPTILPEGLELAAVLPRANVDDWLVAKVPNLSALPEGATVATSSLRRETQLRAARPDLQIVEIRGNVSTRLKKLAADPAWSATVLAAAGLERLGLVKDGMIQVDDVALFVSTLTPQVMLPAVGQGAIGIEVRSSESEHRTILRAINHAPTWGAVSLERELLRSLGGGCQMPLGVRSYEADGEWELEAVLFRGETRTTSCSGIIQKLVSELLQP